jgi:hypothetical protein
MCYCQILVFLLVFVAAACFSWLIFAVTIGDFSFPRTDSFFASSPAHVGQGFGSHLEFVAGSDFRFWSQVYFARFLCAAEFPAQGPSFRSGGQHSPRTGSLLVFSTISVRFLSPARCSSCQPDVSHVEEVARSVFDLVSPFLSPLGAI